MRIVALGASNLTRGLPTVLALARGAWGPDVEVMAALGLGRSYGSPSRILVRVLPSVLDCGLWRALEALPPAPTRAIVTDVGNDILYGFPATEILAWVGEVVARCQRHAADVVIAGLPLASAGTLSPGKFLVVRSLLVPACRLSFEEVMAAAEQVHAGLETLARRSGARFVTLPGRWFGMDPVHVRRSAWPLAWRAMLGVDGAIAAPLTWAETIRLMTMWPEVQHLAGIRHATAQDRPALPRGGRVSLY